MAEQPASFGWFRSWQVTDFTASFEVEFDATAGGGTAYQDGLAFSFGDPAGLSGSPPNGLDVGTGSSGLVIRVKPLGSEIEIFWGGVRIAEQAYTNINDEAPSAITIGVNATGQVDVSYAGVNFSGQITGTEWQTTSQSNFEFILSGRAGAHHGLGYVDDISISANVSCFLPGR